MQIHRTGTAEHIIASAGSNGAELSPEHSFLGTTNADHAFQLACEVLVGEETALVQDLLATAGIEMNYDTMTDAQIRAAARLIVRDSNSLVEIERRLQGEIGYPYDVGLYLEMPYDRHTFAEREAVRGLGGLVMKSGAMVTGRICGHDDWINLH